MNDDIKHLRREILVRLITAFYSNNFEENARLIPYDMRPKGCNVQYRCCIHKERAILKDRIIAALGFSIEDNDEKTLLSDYAKRAVDRKSVDQNHLTILETACKGCVPSRIYITDLCQGCVARPCINVCRFGAISISNGRASVDAARCENCGMCLNNICQYRAITRVIAPCENACPVKAITKNDTGYASIDFEKCISCGKCVNTCPFGAVHEKRQIIDVLKHIKKGCNVVAMIAPAIAGQLPCSVEQLHTAIKKLGFSKVYEVAQGADITAKTEARDFKERMGRGDAFMTTSCCAGYNEFVNKHLKEIAPFCSDTKTPLHYTAEIAKLEHPSSITVFFSPCIAKRKEVFQDPNIDYVLTFEEVGALFIALKIDINSCEPESFPYKSSKQGRNFPLSQGVVKSIIAAYDEDVTKIRPVIINGLTKQNVKELKKYAQTKSCELGNLIEVMCCEGGCIGGNAVINIPRMSYKQTSQYADSGEDIK